MDSQGVGSAANKAWDVVRLNRRRKKPRRTNRCKRHLSEPFGMLALREGFAEIVVERRWHDPSKLRARSQGRDSESAEDRGEEGYLAALGMTAW